MALEPEAEAYLETSPLTADAADISTEEFTERVITSRTLPENVRRALHSPDTSDFIRNLAIRQHALSIEQAKNLAGIVREILLGEISAAILSSLVTQRLGTSPPITQSIVKSITQKLITPNYFQIAQMYEKKQRMTGAGGRRQEAGTDENTGDRRQATGGRRQGMDVSAAPPAPAAMPPTVPPRVVDLRNGAIPSRLPPPPAVVPSEKGVGPSTTLGAGQRSGESGSGTTREGAGGRRPTSLSPLRQGFAGRAELRGAGQAAGTDIAPPVPPPAAPPTPLPAPPKPPVPPGPSAEDLLDNLGKRPAPPPAPLPPPAPMPPRPPGGGAHGPLPIAPNERASP